MKKIRTKKKHFDETVYTFDAHQKATFKSDLSRKGINEFNYVLISINCPQHLDIKDKKSQIAFLIAFLKSLKFFYVACCEWCDERSNGYHLHIIISMEDLKLNLNLFSDDYCYISELQDDHCLDRCLGYITKERKGCTALNRKEKFYFNNIPERKLVPIGVRNIIQEEKPVEAMKEHEEHVITDVNTHYKKPLKEFFKVILSKVKTVFTRLFIEKREIREYGNRQNNLFQNTRDGPIT